MDISKAELINRLDDASKIVEQTLTNLPDKKLEEDFTGVPFFEGKKVGYVLLHLLSHLNYHLGQINYHRRLVS